MAKELASAAAPSLRAARAAPSVKGAPVPVTARGGLRSPLESLLGTAPEERQPYSFRSEQVLESLLLDFRPSGSRMNPLPRGHAGAATGLRHHSLIPSAVAAGNLAVQAKADFASRALSPLLPSLISSTRRRPHWSLCKQERSPRPLCRPGSSQDGYGPTHTFLHDEAGAHTHHDTRDTYTFLHLFFYTRKHTTRRRRSKERREAEQAGTRHVG